MEFDEAAGNARCLETLLPHAAREERSGLIQRRDCNEVWGRKASVWHVRDTERLHSTLSAIWRSNDSLVLFAHASKRRYKQVFFEVHCVRTA